MIISSSAAAFFDLLPPLAGPRAPTAAGAPITRYFRHRQLPSVVRSSARPTSSRLALPSMASCACDEPLVAGCAANVPNVQHCIHIIFPALRISLTLSMLGAPPRTATVS